MSAAHVRLRVDGISYAISVDHVVEVVRYGDVSRVPGAGDAVLGVRNLRGEVLPVFDLGTLLRNERRRPRERVLVVEHGGTRAGFAVDEVNDVSAVEEDELVRVDVGLLLSHLARGVA